MGNVTLTPGTLPAGYCFQSWQRVYNDFFELATAQLGNAGDTLNTFNYGDSAPAPENQGSPWLRTVAGAPNGWYIYYGGAWVWPNAEQPGTSVRRLWEGTLDDLKTYDGGVDEPVGVDGMTGPMWEEAASFAGRFPIHPGAVPDSGTIIQVGQNYGSGQFTLDLENIPPHTHGFNVNSAMVGTKNASDQNSLTATSPAQQFTTDSAGGLEGGTTKAVPLLPGARGIYLIKRTSRIFYKV